MAIRASGWVAGAAFVAVSLMAGRAWAPPLCSYGEKIDGDVLTLRVRLATVDGVQATLPAVNYSLRSGCALDALDGVLADPDASDGKRTVTWTMVTP
jgi:hypothetical protein